MGKYPLNAFHAEAIYTEHERAIYAGNPWIEALPNIPSDQELFKSLEEKIAYEREECELPDYIRRECVNSLTQLFVPLAQNGEIARKVFSAIREGYLNRNPLSHSMRTVSAQLQQCVITQDSSFRSLSGSNANANGFCIVGDSGLGKTTAVNKALNIFPQVITHQQYHDIPFNSSQLVWLRLECPHDCSVKALTTDFFVQFDSVMKDNTYYKYAAGGRSSTDQMIPQMALIAQRHGLGLLIIDEIQNLSQAKSGGAEKMLSFIVRLVNTIGVPILLMGTPTAVPFLSSNLMTIRRSAGQQGMTKLHPLSQDSSDWQRLLKNLWKYQWTRYHTPLTEEISFLLHKYSVGNVDAAVKLYMQAQRIAIGAEEDGGGIIDANAVHAAAHSDELSDVLARLRLEQQWALEKQPKRTSSPPVSDSALQKTPSTQSTKKTPSTGKPQKQKGDLKSLEERGLVVKPTDEF